MNFGMNRTVGMYVLRLSKGSEMFYQMTSHLPPRVPTYFVLYGEYDQMNNKYDKNYNPT